MGQVIDFSKHQQKRFNLPQQIEQPIIEEPCDCGINSWVFGANGVIECQECGRPLGHYGIDMAAPSK